MHIQPRTWSGCLLSKLVAYCSHAVHVLRHLVRKK